MSVPRKNIVWGKILLDKQELGVLSSRHLDETTTSRINEFMKGRKPFAHAITASWRNNQPQWEIEDGKLYLTDIGLSVDMSKGHIVEYQEEDRVEIIKDIDGKTRELKIGRRKIISSNDKRNSMQKIFGKDRLFAEWINEPMKLFVKQSKQKPVIVNQGKPNERTRYEVTMDLLILDIKQGILNGSESTQETYFTVKNYIEEFDDESE